MAIHAGNDSALAQRANLNIAAAVVAKLGTGASDHLIGNVISDVRASHTVAELASAGDMSGLLGAVDTAIARNAETNRPFNITDSRAAQLAGQGAGMGDLGWPGDGSGFGRYSLLQGGRGGRSAANDSGGDGGSSGSSGGGRSSSGASNSGGSYATVGTGGEPAGAPFWGSPKGMMMTRAYANDNAMNWAPPDLMKMGRPALQALKDSGLKGDGYGALHDPSGLHLSNRSIVAGAAGYMKRNGIDHNEAGKASAGVDRLDMPKAMRERHRAAVDGIHTATPENEAERREALRKSDDEIEHHKPGNKDHKAAVDRERKGYKLDQNAAPKAEQKAEQKGAAVQSTGQQANKDDVEAKQKSAAADAKGAKADAKAANNADTSAKMAELLKKRQAAASAPKSPS